MTITSIKIANAMVEQLRAELAAAQATIAEMWDALADPALYCSKGACDYPNEYYCRERQKKAIAQVSNLDALHEERAKTLEDAEAVLRERGEPATVSVVLNDMATAHRARKEGK